MTSLSALKAEMKKVEIKTSPKRLKTLVVEDKVFRSSYDYELSPEDVERARRELNETEEVRNASLRTLKEMLSNDEFSYLTDDEYLLRFLRHRKFNCKEAFKMMHYVYTLSKDYPDVFATLPSNLEALLNSKVVTFLPYRDEDGSMIFIDQIGALWKPSELTIYGSLQFLQPILNIIQMNPSCQINKVVGIFDCKGLSLRQVSAVLYPSTLLFWTKTVQNAYTWRLKHIIFVNCNRLFNIGFHAVRQLLKKKIADRIVVIGSDMTKLHQYVNPAILPKQYGGSLDDSEWGITQHIMDNLSYIEYEQSFRRTKIL